MKLNAQDKSQIEEWISGLRSGEFTQTKRCLQNANGYCCLGVGCKVLIPDNKLIKNGKFLRGEMPSHQDKAPSWLKRINSDFEEETGAELCTLNDNGIYIDKDDTTRSVEDMSFDEIADLLQLVYLEGAKFK